MHTRMLFLHLYLIVIMNILFGKRKSEHHTHIEPEISPSFAQTVLDLESELNYKCTMNNVKKLMELYTKAIEFYEEVKNPKYTHYQERMQILLTRKDVQALLNKTVKPKFNHMHQEEIKENIGPNHVGKSSLPKLPLERNCEKVVQNHNVETSIVSKQIVEHLRTQSESLLQRVESRRNARSKRFRVFETNQCDKSGGEARITPAEEFELEVEIIMERFVEEKNIMKREIEEKYNEYLSEVNCMEGEIIKSLVGELKKNMKLEIEERIKEMEAKRAGAIAVARKKLANKNVN